MCDVTFVPAALGLQYLQYSDGLVMNPYLEQDTEFLLFYLCILDIFNFPP